MHACAHILLINDNTDKCCQGNTIQAYPYNNRISDFVMETLSRPILVIIEYLMLSGEHHPGLSVEGNR